jgi:hypothetical protein
MTRSSAFGKMDDGATVPLFYRKRVPQVLIQNEELDDDLAEIVEDENLDDAQQTKLENRFAKEIEVGVSTLPPSQRCTSTSR